MLEQKRRALIALLIALAVWPFIHFALVQTHGINPWRFFGFAMYCVPRRLVFLDAFARVGDREAPMPFPSSGPPPEVVDYIDRRWAWGPGLEPDGLATMILAAEPALTGVRIDVHHWEMQIDDHRYHRETFSYDYPAERWRLQ